MMELAEATLDRKMCELSTQLYLRGEQRDCGERMLAGLFDAYPAFSQMGGSEATVFPLGLESLAASRTQPATKSSDAGMLGARDVGADTGSAPDVLSAR